MSSDEALLLRIFAEAHCAGFELLGLAPAALDGLIRMQFQARQAQYRMHPGAAEYLICRGDGQDRITVGACWLSDSPEQLRVLDIAVLAEHRRQGIARSVLAELCSRAAAAGVPVRLSVWSENAPARALYRALGFVPDPAVSEDEGSEPGDLGNGYLELRYPPGDAPHARAQHRAGAR
jgi:ribosomal protein S18 acetylase RimI-like enzyme